MSVSQVTIINQALHHIGQEPIISLDDDSKSSRVAAVFYDTARDQVLERDPPWSFATHRQVLTASADENLNSEYLYMYSLPVDPWCLRALDFVDQPLPDKGWLVEGRHLYANVADPTLKYIFRVEDPRWFSANFVAALALRLAADMSESLTGEFNRDLEARYERQLIRAQGADIEMSQYHADASFTFVGKGNY